MLRSSLKFLARDTLVYGLSGAVSKFLAIFVVPLLTRTLSADQFGIYDAVQSLALMFGSVIILGQDSAVARYINEGGDDQEFRRRVARTGFALQLPLMLLFLFLFLFLRNTTGELFLSSRADILSSWSIGLLAVPGAVLCLFSINLFKWTFRRTLYLVVSIGSILATVGCTVIFVFVLHWGVEGALWPIVISNTFFGILATLLNLSLIGNPFQSPDWTLVKKMVRYGAPFMIVNLAGAMLPAVDRIFLSKVVSFHQLGAYALNIKIASLMGFLITSFELAFGPFAFSVWKHGVAHITFGRLSLIYAIASLSFAVVILAAGPLLVSVFGTPEYLSGLVALPFLLLAAVLKGFLAFSMLGIYWSAKPTLNLLVAAIGIAASLFFNYILIPIGGIAGAAAALAVSNACMNAAALMFSRKHFRIEFPLQRFLYLLFCALPVLGASIGIAAGVVPAISLTISALLFPLMAWYFVLEKRDREEAGALISSAMSFLSKS